MKKLKLAAGTYIYGMPTVGKSTLIANSSQMIVDTDNVVFDLLVNANYPKLRDFKPMAPWYERGINRVQWNVICKAGLILSELMANELECSILTNLKADVPPKKVFANSYAFSRTPEDMISLFYARAQAKGKSKDKVPTLATLKSWTEGFDSISVDFASSYKLGNGSFISDYFLENVKVINENEVNILCKEKFRAILDLLGPQWFRSYLVEALSF